MATNRLEWRNAVKDEVGGGKRMLFTAACPSGDYEIMECAGSSSPGLVYESWFTRKADGMLIFLGTARRPVEAKVSCEWDDGRGISATRKARG